MINTTTTKESAMIEPCMAERSNGENHYMLFENMIYVSFPTAPMRDIFIDHNGPDYNMEAIPIAPEDTFPELYYYCLKCPMCKLDEGFLSRTLVCTDYPSTELIWSERDELTFGSLYRLYNLCRTNVML